MWRPWPAALWEPTPAPAEGHDWELFRALGTHLHDVGAEAGLQLDAAIRVALALTADLLAMLRQMLDWELTDLDEMIDDTVQSGIRLYIANATPEPHINHHGGGRP